MDHNESKQEFSHDCGCGCNDIENVNVEWDMEYIPDLMKVITSRVSDTEILRIISYSLDSKYDVDLNSLPADVLIQVRNNRKFIMDFYQLKQNFDMSKYFKTNPLRGLGSGRCECRKWGHWSCNNTRYDQDCVDMNAYFNRANEHCDVTCGNYVAVWWPTPDKC
ncbi:hypothetical protein ACTFRD_24940 [Bacillus cereus group sp. MYBK249-1]|uniref:hypothetical protein n=1 Tax=Bacillus TaxID=1386 RepID=UPI001374D494|nr:MULTISPECIES: hypothetical protein [Bacillus cereus group]MBG9468729.1 hypothetical protein [Bacillus thuringiensis]MDA2072914.1 hypothetical protein [Bacillus cereus]HDR6757706.1 hypothetical protein [Bacillus cereus]